MLKDRTEYQIIDQSGNVQFGSCPLQLGIQLQNLLGVSREEGAIMANQVYTNPDEETMFGNGKTILRCSGFKPIDTPEYDSLVMFNGHLCLVRNGMGIDPPGPGLVEIAQLGLWGSIVVPVHQVKVIAGRDSAASKRWKDLMAYLTGTR